MHEIAVIGGGLAGLTTALAIARTGRRTHLIDPDTSRTDARTTAMLGPTVEEYRKLGVWDHIEEATAPLRTMRIIDGTRRLVRSPTTTFEASEIGAEEFGRNVPNNVATAALRRAIAGDDHVTVHETLADKIEHRPDGVVVQLTEGRTLDVGLVIGADGRRSTVRQAANIGVREWTYPQTAIVTTFEHRLPHNDVSTEFHTENGPATQVPLPGNRSSLVWVTSPTEASELAALDIDELSARIESRLAHHLGRVTVDGPVQTFPMSAQLASAYAGRRTLLVGEAAHAFPPIGAQGFNLTMRDIVDAASAQRDAPDPGAREVTDAYVAMRGRDADVRTFAIDALNRSLMNGLLPVQAAKAVGLGALKALPPLRRLVMREGFQPAARSTLALTNVVAAGVERLRAAGARRG